MVTCGEVMDSGIGIGVLGVGIRMEGYLRIIYCQIIFIKKTYTKYIINDLFDSRFTVSFIAYFIVSNEVQSQYSKPFLLKWSNEITIYENLYIFFQ